MKKQLLNNYLRWNVLIIIDSKNTQKEGENTKDLEVMCAISVKKNKLKMIRNFIIVISAITIYVSTAKKSITDDHIIDLLWILLVRSFWFNPKLLLLLISLEKTQKYQLKRYQYQNHFDFTLFGHHQQRQFDVYPYV